MTEHDQPHAHDAEIRAALARVAQRHYTGVHGAEDDVELGARILDGVFTALAAELHQHFLRDVVSPEPGERYTVTGGEVLDWLRAVLATPADLRAP